MPLFDLRCKSCGARIPITFATIKQQSVQCPNCGKTYTSMEEFQNSPEGPRMAVAMPKGITINNDDGLTIIRKWKSPATYFFTFFALVWNAGIAMFVVTAILSGEYELLLFTSIHILIGLGLVYKVAADFLNETRLQVKFGVLTIQHGPVPWPGKKEYPPGTITQIYCQKNESTSRNRRNVSYSVHWIDKSDKKRTLLGYLRNSDQALFIEQQLEKSLGIQDRPVDGAYT